MLSVVKDNASQLLKQFGLEDDMETSHVCKICGLSFFGVAGRQEGII